MTPSVPALASVWQAPQLVTNRSLPSWRLAGTSSGEALSEPSWVIAQAGTPTPRIRTTSPNMTKVLRFIGAGAYWSCSLGTTGTSGEDRIPGSEAWDGRSPVRAGSG